MHDEISRLRAALGRRERGRGKRFTPKLRQRIGEVGRARHREGASWRAIAQELGLLPETVRRLCVAKPAFTPVEIAEDRAGGRLVLVMPGGIRVEGLTPSTAAEILRKLA